MLSFFFVSFVLFTILFMVRTFYYIFVLLILSLVCLVLLCSSGFMSSLVGILFYVVYVGAIIVLIGYVCAVCPNVLFKSSISLYLLVSLILLSFSSSFVLIHSSDRLSSTSVLLSLYCPDSLYLFVSLVLMLFFVLLIVTTQHLLPKGPFRSVS